MSSYTWNSNNLFNNNSDNLMKCYIKGRKKKKKFDMINKLLVLTPTPTSVIIIKLFFLLWWFLYVLILKNLRRPRFSASYYRWAGAAEAKCRVHVDEGEGLYLTIYRKYIQDNNHLSDFWRPKSFSMLNKTNLKHQWAKCGQPGPNYDWETRESNDILINSLSLRSTHQTLPVVSLL